MDEAETRRNLIDQQLAAVGWSREQGNLRAELFLAGFEFGVAESVERYEAGNQFIDYILLGKDGKPLAILEAKRSSRDALAGQRQAAEYADHIKHQFGVEPFIFLANGQDIWFWDRERHPARKVAGFFRPADLERLSFQRQHRAALAPLGSNSKIVDRPYQLEAIKRVTEALEKGQRKFLLVMATGTGKTRTVIALIDLLMRAKWVQRVLFLADRRELVRQALAEFKEHMPNETRTRLEGGEIDHTARLQVATYPAMLQLYRQLGPGYYDLIIADESHRSIYNRYRAIFEYFDALNLGLTATPTDYIDHNTFDLFECPDGLPTFYYPYTTSVQEGYLVDYRVLEAQTNFQLQGIKAGQLPPEFKRQLEEQGIDLGEIDFEGSDLERRVTNTGTNDALVEEFMTKCRKDATGTLPAKSIIFAMSHRHAVELWESFNRRYPDLQRHGLAEIIDSHMERADKALEEFKSKNMPRVAISVDMLDTGVDIPALQNLVFARPVFSQVKFWQMIGRGTRLWHDPQNDQPKKDFLIIDHWNNFAYFNLKPEGELPGQTESLPVRLFRLRLDKLANFQIRGEIEHSGQIQAQKLATDTIGQLQSMLQLLPYDNLNVRAHLEKLSEMTKSIQTKSWDDWYLLDKENFQLLRQTIAPLLRFLPNIDLAEMLFEVRTEQLALAWLFKNEPEQTKRAEQIRRDLARLPHNLQVVEAQADKLQRAMGDEFWQHLNYPAIMDLQATFAPLMRYLQPTRSEFIRLNLPDQVVSRRWIIYGPGGEGAWAENYRTQVETQVRDLVEQLPALHKLQQQEPLSEADLRELTERLSRPDLFITAKTLQEVYERPEAGLTELLSAILTPTQHVTWEDQVKTAFDEFGAAHLHFSARQLNLLRTIRSAVLRRVHLTAPDLERPPYSRLGSVRDLFTQTELTEVLDLANRLVS